MQTEDNPTLWMYQASILISVREKFYIVAFVRETRRETARARIDALLASEKASVLEEIGLDETDSSQVYTEMHIREALQEAFEGQIGYYLSPLE